MSSHLPNVFFEISVLLIKTHVVFPVSVHPIVPSNKGLMLPVSLLHLPTTALRASKV